MAKFLKINNYQIVNLDKVEVIAANEHGAVRLFSTYLGEGNGYDYLQYDGNLADIIQALNSNGYLIDMAEFKQEKKEDSL